MVLTALEYNTTIVTRFSSIKMLRLKLLAPTVKQGEIIICSFVYINVIAGLKHHWSFKVLRCSVFKAPLRSLSG